MRQVLLTMVGTLLLTLFSLSLSHYTSHTDFPIFYLAAKHFQEGKSLASVYDISTSGEYGLPETTNEMYFIYSPSALVLMSPLASLDYHTAKALLILLNLVAYLLSVYLFLGMLPVRGRRFALLMALSLAWMPFFSNLLFAQINAILLLLVVLALAAAHRGRPWLGGGLLAAATLFKLFPLGFAVFLAIRNWRILAGCLLGLSASLLVPGSPSWISALSNVHSGAVSPVYRHLGTPGPIPYLLFSALVVLATAYLCHRARNAGLPEIAAFCIPAVFLVMPVLEYYHLTFLYLSFACLIHLFLERGKAVWLVPTALLMVQISTNVDDPLWGATYLSVLLTWVVFAWVLMWKTPSSTRLRQG